MPLNYCKTCAEIRGMEVRSLQNLCACEICGTKALCSFDSIAHLRSAGSAFEEKGYLNSKDLVSLLALVKTRKAILLPRIKQLQIELGTAYKNALIQEEADELFELSQAKKKTVDGYAGVLKKVAKIASKWVALESVRDTKSVILHNLIGEQSGLNEREKELNMLYKSTLDQILIERLMYRVGQKGFEKAYEEAKDIYQKRTKAK